MTQLLSVKNLNKRFPNFQLKNINVELDGGLVLGLIGENGAGKTTFLKCILNMMHIDSGEVLIFGQNMSNTEKDVKKELGVVFEQCPFGDHIEIKDVADIIKRMHPKFNEAKFYDYTEHFGLPRKQKIKTFSKGMKMKLSIVTALACDPRLLILDEPTSGLDPVVRGEILDIFSDFVSDEEHGIIFSSHITSDIEQIADYVVYIDHGQIVFNKEKDEIRDNFAIVKMTAEQFSHFDPQLCLGYEKSQFGVEALVENKSDIQEAYPELIFERVNLDQIMRYHSKGGK